MPFDQARALADIDRVLSSRHVVDDDKYAEIAQALAAMCACIDRYSKPGSSYRTRCELHANVLQPNTSTTERVRGVLMALRDDVASGHLASITAIVHADVFSDYLEMAQHLNDAGHKDAAAVICGSSLEAHLRALCAAQATPIPVVKSDGKPQRADTLNAELNRANAYSLGDQKQVTAWLDLRNDAAHGHYARYDHARVALMIDGVRLFIARAPA